MREGEGVRLADTFLLQGIMDYFPFVKTWSPGRAACISDPQTLQPFVPHDIKLFFRKGPCTKREVQPSAENEGRLCSGKTDQVSTA